MNKRIVSNTIDLGLDTIKKYPIAEHKKYKEDAENLLLYAKSLIERSNDQLVCVSYLYQKIKNEIAGLIALFNRHTRFEEAKFESFVANILLYITKLPDESSTLATKIEKIHDESENSYREIKRTLEQTYKLANLVAENSLKDGFENVSISEKKEADNFRRGAIAMFITGILASGGFLIIELLCPQLAFNSIQTTIYKIAFIALTLTFAFFLARESTFHRQAQYFNKQLALDMAVLDPFLSGLNDESKSEIKKQLSIKLFGMTNLLNSSGKDNSATINLILSKLLDKSLR